MACKKNHSIADEHMRNIPIDQGGVGRHKCASCAYDKGYIDGLERKEVYLTPINWIKN